MEHVNEEISLSSSSWNGNWDICFFSINVLIRSLSLWILDFDFDFFFGFGFSHDLTWKLHIRAKWPWCLQIFALIYCDAFYYSKTIILFVNVIIQATMYPGAQVLWAKWSPPEERSRLVGFSFGGKGLTVNFKRKTQAYFHYSVISFLIYSDAINVIYW